MEPCSRGTIYLTGRPLRMSIDPCDERQSFVPVVLDLRAVMIPQEIDFRVLMPGKYTAPNRLSKPDADTVFVASLTQTVEPDNRSYHEASQDAK